MVDIFTSFSGSHLVSNQPRNFWLLLKTLDSLKVFILSSHIACVLDSLISRSLLEIKRQYLLIWVLRTYATKYFPCWNLFNSLHTVCFMHGLSIYEIKRKCHRAYLFIISSGIFQYLTNFLNRWKNNTSPKYRAKIVVIFIQLCFH